LKENHLIFSGLRTRLNTLPNLIYACRYACTLPEFARKSEESLAQAYEIPSSIQQASIFSLVDLKLTGESLIQIEDFLVFAVDLVLILTSL